MKFLTVATFFIQAQLCWGAVVNNKILGTPQVICTQQGVLFEMETEHPFIGQLYVKNEYDNPKCRVSFGKMDKKPGAEFRLNFNDCNMRRQRMVKPKGMVYSVTMMVQFHEVFVTFGDKAFQIRCFYQEMDSGNVTSSLDVSALTTTLMDATNNMPSCHYSIKMKAVDGPKASVVKVGDTVVHMFKCDETNKLYRLLVKDCYVDDGKQNKHKIIGSDGCSVDTEIMQTPVYVEGKLEALAEASVFKWPDEPSVYFQCQISLCMEESGSCDIVTPPKCGKSPKRRSLINSTINDSVEFDLDVRKMTVIDIGQESEAVNTKHLERLTRKPPTNFVSEDDNYDLYHSEPIFSSVRPPRADNCLSVESLIIVGMIIFVFSILIIATTIKLLVTTCRNSKSRFDDPYSVLANPARSSIPNMYYSDYSTYKQPIAYLKI